MQVKKSVFINVSAETIFTYLSNLDNLSAWSSATGVVEGDGPDHRVESSSSQAIHAGVTLHSTIRFLGKRRGIIFEVVECEPYSALTIKSISGVAPCYFYYQFDPVANGGTEVTLEFGIDLAENLVEQAQQIAVGALRRQIDYDLLTLKDILEIGALLCKQAE